MTSRDSRKQLDKPSLNKGFTLVEMMVTVSVMIILLVVAVPNFRVYLSSQTIRNATFDLMADLMLARSEAIKRNANIDLVAKCQGWQDGWDVKLGTTVLRTHASMTGIKILDSQNLTVNCSSLPTVRFTNSGRLDPASNSIIFTIAVYPSNTSIKSRCIRIDLSGRANSSMLYGSGC